MKSKPVFPLSSRITAMLKKLSMQARDVLKVDGYRPEKHYMRGPGPKAKAKGAKVKGAKAAGPKAVGPKAVGPKAAGAKAKGTKSKGGEAKVGSKRELPAR